jgi:hypothetical protein
MDRIHDHTGVDEDTTISRPVTARSRITGTRTVPVESSARHVVEHRSIDWAAVIASVVSGIAVTAMLVLLGVAAGLISGNEGTDGGEAAGILGAVGAWSVVAMVIGAFVGSLLGGRLARWLDRGSLGYHALTSWGLATLLTIVLASIVSIAFAEASNAVANTATAAETTTDGQADDAVNGAAGAEGQPADGTPEGQTGTDANSAEETADDTADALGGAGLGIFLSMLLTLAASGAGWWIGSRKRLLDIEREPDDSRVVA